MYQKITNHCNQSIIFFNPVPDRTVRSDNDGNLQLHRYTVIGCDLTKTDKLFSILRRFGLDPSLPVLVLCECSLTYVAEREATAVYRWIAATFADAHLIAYEQVNVRRLCHRYKCLVCFA